MWLLAATLDRSPAPITAAFFTSLGADEKALLYAAVSALLAVVLDWLRRKMTRDGQ